MESYISYSNIDNALPFLKALAHPVRIRIVDFLALHKTPQRVTEIVAATEGEQQAIVSQHLKVLRDSNLLDCKRVGNSVYYWVCDDIAMEYLRYVRKLVFAVDQRGLKVSET